VSIDFETVVRHTTVSKSIDTRLSHRLQGYGYGVHEENQCCIEYTSLVGCKYLQHNKTYTQYFNLVLQAMVSWHKDHFRENIMGKD
jgi:hypothetical protein